jgi:hypothetical protein
LVRGVTAVFHPVTNGKKMAIVYGDDMTYRELRREMLAY